MRALARELRALQAALAAGPGAPDLYRVLDTTLLPALHRVRACRRGLFVGQATFGYRRSKTDRVYGFKVAPAVTPAGVVTAFGLAPAACAERPIGDALVAAAGSGCYLADKGFAGAARPRTARARRGSAARRMVSGQSLHSRRVCGVPGAPPAGLLAPEGVPGRPARGRRGRWPGQRTAASSWTPESESRAAVRPGYGHTETVWNMAPILHDRRAPAEAMPRDHPREG